MKRYAIFPKTYIKNLPQTVSDLLKEQSVDEDEAVYQIVQKDNSAPSGIDDAIERAKLLADDLKLEVEYINQYLKSHNYEKFEIDPIDFFDKDLIYFKLSNVEHIKKRQKIIAKLEGVLSKEEMGDIGLLSNVRDQGHLPAEENSTNRTDEIGG